MQAEFEWSPLHGLARLNRSFSTSPRRTSSGPSRLSRSGLSRRERERRPEKEGRKVENEWKAVVPGMDSAQPIQAWLNELTTELGEHYEDPTMLALIDKNKILFLLGQLD